MRKITNVTVLDGHRLALVFDEGPEGRLICRDWSEGAFSRDGAMTASWASSDRFFGGTGLERRR